jgi:hypothetical protein
VGELYAPSEWLGAGAYVGLLGRKKVFFFEKKKQKTFAGCRGLAAKVRQELKVFWFFFSKKNVFLPS